MMKMKKIAALALCLALCTLMLAGCGGSAGQSGGSASPAGEDVLTVATSPDFAPTTFVDTSKEGQDQYVGFDIAVAQYIADQMGKTLVIQPMSFDACTTAVSMGTVDMALAGFAWREDRAENFNLSNEYSPSDDPNLDRQVIITLKDKEGQFTAPEDFAGVKVGAQTASLQESLCREQIPGCELVIIGDLGTGLLQLKNGDFACMACAYPQAEVFMTNDPDIALAGFDFEVDDTGTVIVMQKGADELTAQVNEILAKAAEEGLMGGWYAEAVELAKSATASEVTFDDSGNAAS